VTSLHLLIPPYVRRQPPVRYPPPHSSFSSSSSSSVLPCTHVSHIGLQVKDQTNYVKNRPGYEVKSTTAGEGRAGGEAQTAGQVRERGIAQTADQIRYSASPHFPGQ